MWGSRGPQEGYWCDIEAEISIITVWATFKVLLGPHGPRIFISGLKAFVAPGWQPGVSQGVPPCVEDMKQIK